MTGRNHEEIDPAEKFVMILQSATRVTLIDRGIGRGEGAEEREAACTFV